MRPVRKAENLPPSCAVVTKSWNLNFLETSEPVQACNGTALPFTRHAWNPLSLSRPVMGLLYLLQDMLGKAERRDILMNIELQGRAERGKIIMTRISGRYKANGLRS